MSKFRDFAGPSRYLSPDFAKLAPLTGQHCTVFDCAKSCALLLNNGPRNASCFPHKTFCRGRLGSAHAEAGRKSMFRKSARLLSVTLRGRGLSSDVQRLAYNAHPPTKLQEQLLQHSSPVPIVVTGAMDNWQARNWTRSDLMQHGDTIVPVERSHNGGDYRDLHNASSTRGFEADLEVPLSAVLQSMQDTRQQPVQSLLYAAQVDLISLIPALEEGIEQPPLRAIHDRLYKRNSWLGPAGTITPLHCDPYFNLFCQIWGSKYIRIYDRKHAQQLHPFSNPFLRNTSQVHVEKVDSKMFPNFDQVPYLECHLMPGEMLFMPKKFWHFVQALEPSWSVSYWWT